MKNAHLLASDNIENLGRSVATGGNILAIMTETNAADNTLVVEIVDKINVQHTRDFWVEDCEPIRLDLLQMRRKALEVQLGERISNLPELLRGVA